MAANIIKGLQNELTCVVEQKLGNCDKDCQKCNLVFEDAEIIRAYIIAISILRTILKERREEVNINEFI